MIGWLYRIIIGSFSPCKHSWEIYSEGQYQSVTEDGRIAKQAMCYVLKCSKCGNMKREIL